MLMELRKSELTRIQNALVVDFASLRPLRPSGGTFHSVPWFLPHEECSQRQAEQKHRQPEADICRAPPVQADQILGKRRQHHGTHTRSGHDEGERHSTTTSNQLDTARAYPI